MTFYGTNAARRLRAFLPASLALGLGMAGCAGDEPKQTTEVGTAYEALAVQLQNCSSNALDCYQAANCDDAAEQACREEFRACREATRDAYRAYQQAVGACFRDKLECVRNVWSDGGSITADGGAEGFQTCRDDFQVCVEADRPIPPEPGPCMSGLRTCVQDNVQWGEDGSRAALHDCLSEAHMCIQNRLPVCDDDAGAGGAAGTGAAGAGGAGAEGGAGATGGFGGAGGATDGGV